MTFITFTLFCFRLSHLPLGLFSQQEYINSNNSMKTIVFLEEMNLGKSKFFRSFSKRIVEGSHIKHGIRTCRHFECNAAIRFCYLLPNVELPSQTMFINIVIDLKDS